MGIKPVLVKKLPEQLGLYRYAVSTHADQFALSPTHKKIPGSAYCI